MFLLRLCTTVTFTHAHKCVIITNTLYRGVRVKQSISVCGL